MERFETDVVVIGAGAVGLAVARSLALAGRDVMVLEAASGIATETSSRNSEVIHAGLYYPSGSLKARLCVRGRRLLYEYCERRGIEARACGKFVVAVTDAEAEAVPGLLARARANEVEDLSVITGEEARRIEPALSRNVRMVLVSPVSGIFDSHAYFLSLQGEIEDRGGAVVFETPVVRGRVKEDGLELETGGASPVRISARAVINSAGHRALDIARAIDGGPQYPGLKMRWVKGSYFSASGPPPFSRLIYPMHNSASLGLHLSVDLAGRTRLGPDAEWLDETVSPPFDYSVDPARAELCYAEVRRYWPGLPDGAIAPDYSGVRPKIVGPGEAPGDFLIDGPERHRVQGLVNLIGIESPGLTSSLAIGDWVTGLLNVR